MERRYTYSTGKVITMPSYAFHPGTGVDRRTVRLFDRSQVQPGTTHGGYVAYEHVTVEEKGEGENLGKTVYKYHVPATYGVKQDGIYKATVTHVAAYPWRPVDQEHIPHITGTERYPFAPNPMYDWNRGQLLEEKVYDNTGKLRAEKIYKYKNYYAAGNKPYSVYGIRFAALIPFDMSGYTTLIRYSKFEYLTGVASVLSQVTEKNYEAGSAIPFTCETFYEYSPNHLKPVGIKRTREGHGDFVLTRYKYALDYYVKGMPDTDPTGLLIKNRMNKLIEQTEFIQLGGVNYLTYAQMDDYNGEIYPTATFSLKPATPITNFKPSSDEGMTSITKDSRYKQEKRYRWYDEYGNCRETTDSKDGVSTVVLWSYKGKHPVAVIRNATYAEVNMKLGATLMNGLAAKLVPTKDDFKKINALRQSLSKAEVTTYVYYCDGGPSEVINPQGMSTEYAYDNRGRPTLMYYVEKDEQGQSLIRLQKLYTYTPYKFD
ncbi:MAG: hypothetical protein LUE93_16455 [Bacteroides sp.]|nr:hypothetical protein [Bacteroides sp.]